MKSSAKEHLNDLSKRYPALMCCAAEVEAAAQQMIACYQNGGKLLVCGNGGSASDSLHIVGELTKGFVLPRKLDENMQKRLREACPEMAEYCIENLQGALPAISLVSEAGLTTAYANDQAPDLAFAQQVLGQAKPGDVLLAISTSGNSANVLYAIGIARALAIEPEFIVCDEPISALDVSIQAQVINLLEQLQRERGLTYLFIAHDLSMVKHISDRIGVMYLGSLVELADSEELFENPMHPYTKALLSAIPIPDPDIEKNRQRIMLEGTLPNPIDLGEECKFCSRCPVCKDSCHKSQPKLVEVKPGHFVACSQCAE